MSITEREHVNGSATADELDPATLATMSGEDALQALAEQVGRQADVRMVYGDPIERDGVTIVPVASVRWGFGIGSGFRSAPMRTGGGGAMATPVGYLEISGGRCRFVPLAGRVRTGGLVRMLTDAASRWTGKAPR
jgi:uncharacterized spore protein YtfJ